MSFVPRLTPPSKTDKRWVPQGYGGYSPCIEVGRRSTLPNCFSGDTKIITRSGVVRLDSIVDQEVEVLSLGGVYRKATGRCFGKQPVYRISFADNSTFICTANHRWVVRFDGAYYFKTTMELNELDVIPYNRDDESFTRVKSIVSLGMEQDVYCVQEPETHTMTLDGGILTGQCVGYAWGRFLEIMGGTKCKLSFHNAELWFGNTADGYERGKSPRLGAVICWMKGKTLNKYDGAGHVAIVEKIHPDGSLTISESWYGKKDFNIKVVKPPNYYYGSNYTFQGFIYNPGGGAGSDHFSKFIDTAKSYINKKQSSSIDFLMKCAKEAGILDILIPNVAAPSDLGKKANMTNGTFHVGPARGVQETPNAGDIMLLRNSIYSNDAFPYSCDRVAIVLEVKGNIAKIADVGIKSEVLLQSYDITYNKIAGYYRPNWALLEESSAASENIYPMSNMQQIYSSVNTAKDAILREVSYFKSGKPILSYSGMKLSAINYTTFLTKMTGGAGQSSFTVTPLASQTYMLDGMKNQNARVIMQFLLNKGLTEAQAIGFLANIQMESGFLPSAVNKSSGASGICQWFQSRCTAMKSFVGTNWKDNLTGQCEYLWKELNSTEKNTLVQVRNKITTNTREAAEQATIVVLYAFERPGRGEAAEERRKGYARDLWDQLVPVLKPA